MLSSRRLSGPRLHFWLLRSGLCIVLSLATLVGVKKAQTRVCDWLGAYFGRHLAAVQRLPLYHAQQSLKVAEALPESENVGVNVAALMAATGAGAEPRAKRGAAKTRPTIPSILVRASTVLKLAERRALPSGVAVEAKGKRPPGIQVHQVAGLGIGVRDGDVLSEVAGTPVSSAGEVIALVLAARQRRAAQISGRLWREDGSSYYLIVEQPYPRAE